MMRRVVGVSHDERNQLCWGQIMCAQYKYHVIVSLRELKHDMLQTSITSACMLFDISGSSVSYACTKKMERVLRNDEQWSLVLSSA